MYAMVRIRQRKTFEKLLAENLLYAHSRMREKCLREWCENCILFVRNQHKFHFSFEQSWVKAIAALVAVKSMLAHMASVVRKKAKRKLPKAHAQTNSPKASSQQV